MNLLNSTHVSTSLSQLYFCITFSRGWSSLSFTNFLTRIEWYEMFLLIFTLLLAIFPLFLLYIHLKWAAEDNKIGAPGPPCIPIIGNLHNLWKNIRNVNGNWEKQVSFLSRMKNICISVHEKILELMDEYGETIRLRFGPKLVLLTRDVKIIEVRFDLVQYIHKIIFFYRLKANRQQSKVWKISRLWNVWALAW